MILKQTVNFFIKTVIFGLFCITGVLKTVNADSSYNSFYKSEWKDVKLGELFLVGAHDAGTAPGANFSIVCSSDDPIRTQGVELDQLFKSGVRYFDIRLKKYKEGGSNHDEFKHGLCSIKGVASQVIERLRDEIRTHDHEIILLDMKNHDDGARAYFRHQVVEYLKNTFDQEYINPNDINRKLLANLTLNELYQAAKKKYGNNSKENVVIILGYENNFIDGITFNSKLDINSQDPFYEKDHTKEIANLNQFSDNCINNQDKRGKFCRLASYFDNDGLSNVKKYANYLQDSAIQYLYNHKTPQMEKQVFDKYGINWNPGGILYFDFADRCFGANYSKCGLYVDSYNNTVAIKVHYGEFLPNGDYMRTCNDIKLLDYNGMSVVENPSVLQAACKTGHGDDTTTSSLSIHHCVSEIHNINGRLSCTMNLPPPFSPLTDSKKCTDLHYITDNQLACWSQQGRDVTLNYNYCKKINVPNYKAAVQYWHGQLICTEPGYDAPNDLQKYFGLIVSPGCKSVYQRHFDGSIDSDRAYCKDIFYDSKSKKLSAKCIPGGSDLMDDNIVATYSEITISKNTAFCNEDGHLVVDR